MNVLAFGRDFTCIMTRYYKIYFGPITIDSPLHLVTKNSFKYDKIFVIISPVCIQIVTEFAAVLAQYANITLVREIYEQLNLIINPCY